MDARLIAAQLLKNDYMPIPIEPGQKRPRDKGWQTKAFVPSDFNDNQSVGIRTGDGGLAFMDIDVYCPTVATEIANEWKRRFPSDAFFQRTGMAPKTGFMFRMPEPCKKLKCSIDPTGCEPEGKKSGLEMLGLGQQFVAFGIHPETGEPYYWHGDDPTGVFCGLADLQEVSEEQVRGFMDWATDTFGSGGAPKITPVHGVVVDTAAETFSQVYDAFSVISDYARPSVDEVNEILSYLDADMDHDNWVKVLMALHDLGDDMLPVAVGWSARGTKFKPGDVEARWASFTQGGGVAWATVPAMARDVGANLRHITIRHRSLIPSTNGVTVQADGAPNGVAVRMDGAPNYPDWKMSKNGDPVAPLATRGNLEALIDWAGVGVHYDVYSRSVIALDGTREITNNVDARILDLAAKYQLPKAAVVDQIDAVAFDRSINKPLQWLEKLEKPKGDPLADWISQSKMVPEDCKTFEQIRPTWPYVIWSKFFIACCAAADQLQRTPNKEALHKFEQVVVIVSNQGMKKSTAIRGLLPPELRGYYGEGIGLDLSSKDSLLGATKFWIAELGELDATFRKSDIAALKAFLSKSGDEVRLPFGKRTEFLPRRTVYFASVNVREFLQDNTGNRRYLPIDISEPLAYSEELGKRIFAQAWHRYIGGDPWWLSVEEDAEARVRQAEHDGNPYIQAILENFDLSSARRDFKVKPGILLEALGLRGEAIGRARNSLKSALSHFNIRKATGSARDGRFYMLPPAYPDFAWKYAMAKNGERNAFTGGGEGCAEND